MRRPILIGLAMTMLLAALPAHAREPGLWATINICDPPTKPGAVGVRVSVPAHGPRKQRQQQWARIRIQWFDGTMWQFIGPAGDSGYHRLGTGRTTIQGGTTFTFQPPPAGQQVILRGVVDVQWRLRRRVKGRATLPTETGHADPRNKNLTMSESTCEIKR